MSRFSIENFLSHSTETFRRGTLLCCVSENFWWRKTLWVRRRGKYQDFPWKNFFVSQCRKNSQGNPLGCHWFRVSKNFMLQRVMSRFSIENFLSHSTETFRRGTLLCCVSENFWWRKTLWVRRRGKYQDFPWKNFFVSQCRKNSQGNPLGCHWFRVSKNFMLQRVMSRFFVEFLLSRSTEKFCRGTLLCCVSDNIR